MARNGFLGEDGIVLVTVEDDDQLIPTAAAAFFAARAAAARDGVNLTIVEPAGAYRRAWVQADMVDHPERWNLNPNSSIGFSRYGQSHGWGNRIDINSAAVPWMLRRGHEFGWSREYGTRDPNHFKHDGVTAVVDAGKLVGVAGARHRIEEEDDMPKIIGNGDEVAIIDRFIPNGYRVVKNTDPLFASEKRLYSPTGDGAVPMYDADVYLGILKAAGVQATRVQQHLGALLPGGSATVPDGLASKADVDAAADRVIAGVDAAADRVVADVPAAVIVEQKKPGN